VSRNASGPWSSSGNCMSALANGCSSGPGVSVVFWTETKWTPGTCSTGAKAANGGERPWNDPFSAAGLPAHARATRGLSFGRAARQRPTRAGSAGNLAGLAREIEGDKQPRALFVDGQQLWPDWRVGNGLNRVGAEIEDGPGGAGLRLDEVELVIVHARRKGALTGITRNQLHIHGASHVTDLLNRGPLHKTSGATQVGPYGPFRVFFAGQCALRFIDAQRPKSSDWTVQWTGNVMTPTYMLTLCRLDSPVLIKPPQAQQLQKFEFFTSCSRHSDGSERLYLHMGYFSTATEAQNWERLVRRGTYPEAIATRVPPALLERRNSAVPTLQPLDAASLTDTQVLNILETRRFSPVKPGAPDTNSSDISLLRPEDTQVRKVLREAVAGNAPIFFAVQLMWSVQPIDPNTVPLLSIFRAHTLYGTETCREGRSWYSIRLGFFKDAISAKQVASYVRSSFSAVAVVPVTEGERIQSTHARIDTTALTDTFNQAAPSPPAAPVISRPAAKPSGKKDSLERTLEILASSEVWENDDDSLSETGVRHLTIKVEKRSSGR
jgi:hypothetical protein